MHSSNRPNDILLALKASSRSRNLEEQKTADRQRDCLILILSFLRQNGYIQTATRLQEEGGSIFSRWERADNIDLTQVLSEYEEFYNLKYGRKPLFSRKVGIPTKRGDDGKGRSKSAFRPTTSPTPRKQKNRGGKGNSGRNSAESVVPKRLLPAISRSGKIESLIIKNKDHENDSYKADASKTRHEDIYLTSTKLDGQKEESTDEHDQKPTHDERVIKPLPSFDDPELRNLASSIQRDILDSSPDVNWDDIVGLEDAKRILKEAIVMPLRFPDLFHGPLLTPCWRGALLFGLPGTGKTLLAKGVATETNTTFFNISASSIVSKYRGDSEKLIRVLFKLARYHAPSTIFFDEIDAIMSHRGSGQGSSGGEGAEHEGSRRMKTELLVEMDGVGRASGHVFVLAATNLPWDLDPALLRRLDKRILVPEPNADARKMMIRKHFANHINSIGDEDLEECAKRTESYSGADIKLLCKEAAMAPIRCILQKIEETESPTSAYGHKFSPSPRQQTQAQKASHINTLLKQNPISILHFRKSLERTRPSTCLKLSKRYKDWADSYGSA